MTADCRACGKTWSRHPAKEVPCPNCNAAIGSPCRRPSDHPCSIHVARERLALAVTDFDPCPANGGETVPTAARKLLAGNDSLTSALEELDLTRADLQHVATGTTIEANRRVHDEDHQPIADSPSDTAEESTTETNKSADHSQSIQTTLLDPL
jgi:hypothetical protein